MIRTVRRRVGVPGFSAALLIVTSSSATVATAQSVIYVDDSAAPTGRGTSWCDAYVHLQDALSAAANSGGTTTEIRIAGGVYTPDTGANQVSGVRESTFQLVAGVDVMGGFAGCGSADPDARDFSAFETVLSGDLARNDVGVRWDTSRYENAFHVVTIDGAAGATALDGVTVYGGRADIVGAYDSGAGVLNRGGTLTLTSCTLEGNWAYSNGGGLYNLYGDSTLLACTIRDNSADYGAGICNEGSTSTVADCDIYGNGAGYFGAGVYNARGSLPGMIRCRLFDNNAYYSGGGMYSTGRSSPRFTECMFAANRARNGGAMYNDDESNPRLTHCRLEGNAAVFSGGAIYNAGDGHAELINCLLVRNRAGSGATVVNPSGGVEMTNCTLGENIATSDAGGILSNGAGLSLTNCILWGNSDSNGRGETTQIKLTDASAPVVKHTCIEGWTGTLGGTENFGENPLLVPGPVGCYYLSHISAGQSSDSPCVHTGYGTVAGLGLATRTTRSDEGSYTGTVDLGYHHEITGHPLVLGDFDRSGLIDLTDASGWVECMSGPAGADVSPCCRILDFNADRDVDLSDYVLFQSAFVGE